MGLDQLLCRDLTGLKVHSRSATHIIDQHFFDVHFMLLFMQCTGLHLLLLGCTLSYLGFFSAALGAILVDTSYHILCLLVFHLEVFWVIALLDSFVSSTGILLTRT